ncbi:MAG: carotenoid 1,2-hydratase [Gemmatimonadota bacterium]|nr:carotenoid 1,2-hydratase [Gemmatimonadota bacterium]MDH4350887.1 carotenoid 1,2-hydratase [Gemmatimonadota bacterium]
MMSDDGGRAAARQRGRAAGRQGGRAAAFLLVAAAIVAVIGPVRPIAPVAPIAQWLPADSAYTWSFPRDHWSHPGYKTEWWYFTGHLTPEGSRAPRFGYQFTFFRIGLLAERPPLVSGWAAQDLVMGHLALSDLSSGRHVFSEILYRASPLLGGFPTAGDTLVAWSRGPAGTATPWTLAWTDGGFTIAASDERQRIALSLTTHPSKPLVFQGPNGYSRKGVGPNAASQYYSLTRLTTDGHVVVGTDTLTVSGTSWMDKEFGSNQLAEGQSGWDWFSLQLDDGREVMLYRLRSRDGAGDYARGTFVSATGEPTYLASGEWALTVDDRWRSQATGADYPARWRITLPAWDLALDVRPLLAAQENVSRVVPGLGYWEGAVTVHDAQGGVLGRGYVELTGYADGGRLPI